MNILPQKLKKGDQVAIISTARKVNAIDLAPAIAVLKKWELTPVIGSSIGLTENQFAGSDKERAKDLQQQLNNPEIKAIWCAKGGYGSVRILDLVDFSALQQAPKWIIGYSDVTALHAHLHLQGIASLHAQMCIDVETKSKASRETLKDILFGEKPHYNFPYAAFNKIGTAKGTLIGGNLSVLYSLCGSNSAVNTKGKILFLEDLDEYLYHIDRMMQNLKRNGMLENLAGLIVGGMTDMNDNTIPFGKTATEIILSSISEYSFPVAFNFPAGHIWDNQALILGTEATLKVTSKQSRLTYC
ncbi:muramoyltetrapeptide carboxypeptidase [Mesonia hippocampi]|uniref:Muramoyltetrapeptide carboxypeptidase n=1 Tax=Mesonia hippocampi TaxID=1628250 RepID=A0A840ETQ1_9FLAO|nr:LD-carboxypeptidase [Mesonia hippocampi]MBB4118277.1 muramoyltetrapeptide carboxypeptidase [Mesonia hippocampi]